MSDSAARIERVCVGKVRIGRGCPLALIAGPCVIESQDHCLRLAEFAADLCRRLEIGYVFKASFDKANRSSGKSFRGPGLEQGLAVLQAVKEKLGLPVLSDVHTPDQVQPASDVLDVLQIPAFLCRQTDLVEAAGRSGKVVNVKKGQFLSPEEMANVVAKLADVGNRNVLLTERGTFFGYNRLVNDMTGIPKMRAMAPVIFDATHSCQLPGGAGDHSAGQREHVGVVARAGIAAGADGLFLEIHDDPVQAKSDAATVFPIERLEDLVRTCIRIASVIR